MKKILIILISIFLMHIDSKGVPLLMNENFSAVGTSLAGAGVSKWYKSIDGIYDNPSSIYGLKSKEVQAGWTGLPVGDIGLNYVYILYGQSVNKIINLDGYIGTGVYFLNISSDMNIYDEIGNSIDTIKNSDYMVKLFYSSKFISKIQYGVSMNYFYSSLDESVVNGICFDIGGLYITSLPSLFKGMSVPKYNASVGIDIENIGFMINKGYIGEGNLPIKIISGINYKWNWKNNNIMGLYVSVAYMNSGYSSSYYVTESFGVEWELSKIFIFRSGYKLDNKYNANAFTAGIGINYKKGNNNIKFDYGINFNKFINIHSISFNVGF